MGPGSWSPWIIRHGPAGFLESPAVFTLEGGGAEGDWQERKSSLKGDVEQLFSIFPKEKGEEITASIKRDLC